MVRIKVTGKVNGADGATIEIDRGHETLTVRPKRLRQTYTLKLDTVCEMVVGRCVKLQMGGDAAMVMAKSRPRS